MAKSRRLPWLVSAPNSVAAVGAFLFTCAAFTPSLLPRPWWLQAVVDGCSALVGYALFALAAWLLGSLFTWRPSPGFSRRLRWAVWSAMLPLLAVAMYAGQRWQREIHLLMGQPPPPDYAWLPIILLSLAILAAGILLGRGFVALTRWVAGHWLRPLPRRLAAPLSVVLVAVALVAFNNNVLWRQIVAAMDRSMSLQNSLTRDGVERPIEAERSGSPASLVSWRSLGSQGRDFVAGAPTVAKLSRFARREAKPPIRAYAGLESEPDPARRAALVVAELERTGAFERKVLLVVTSTGTGWVEPGVVEAIEFMYAGDTATASMQYSYLPSWFSFLVDADRARVAGRELFNAVYDAWQERPAEHRPLLLVGGTSLGVLGGEAAFSGLADLRGRTDGVVWAGAPKAAELHARLVADRTPGSFERLPVYEAGKTVRFAARSTDLAALDGEWQRPRVLYLQNGSDPIVYWDPELAIARPDWLEEPSAPDVLPEMRWLPFVTFWQVSADLPYSLEQPSGHGHDYRHEFVAAWAAVAPPPGWSAADTARLQRFLR